MSIERYEVAANLESGALCPLKPPKGIPPARLILMAAEMRKAVLQGPWQDDPEMIRLSKTLYEDLVRFMRGDKLLVSLGGKEVCDDLKRLENVNEVWELKSKAKRGVRVFGRFIARDWFVATHWQWRDTMGTVDSDAWSTEANKALRIWGALFDRQAPHFGDTIDAYVSNAADASLVCR